MIIYWDNLDVLPVFIIMAKFGVSANFNMVYVGFVQLIPTMYITTVFGLCNVVARLVTFMSPMIAEVEYPYPMAISIAALAFAAGMSLTLVVKQPKFI